MSDIHALVGVYAVDALDDIERAQFERHLASCAACRAEVDGLREASALLAATTPVSPPAALRSRLLTDIKTVRPLPPQVTEARAATTPVSRRRSRRWFPGLVAAAALIGAVGVGAAVTQPWDDTQQTSQLSAAERVLGAPDARRVSQSFPDGAKATVVSSVSEHHAVIVTENMPAAPAGKVYQLWLQDDEGAMVPAGLMPPKSDQTVVLDGDPATATGVGITVEPEGGSPEPTSDPIAVFEFSEPAEPTT